MELKICSQSNDESRTGSFEKETQSANLILEFILVYLILSYENSMETLACGAQTVAICSLCPQIFKELTKRSYKSWSMRQRMEKYHPLLGIHSGSAPYFHLIVAQSISKVTCMDTRLFHCSPRNAQCNTIQ